MMTVLVVLLTVAVGVLTLIVFGLLRTHAEILRALDRLGVRLDDPVGAVPVRLGQPPSTSDPAQPAQSPARDIVGVSPGGGPTKVSVTGSAGLTLLAFLSSGCRTCKSFTEESSAGSGFRLPGNSVRMVIVGQDPAHESESAFAALVPAGVKAVMSTDAWHHYGVPGAPYFALVDGPSGRLVGTGTATSWKQLRGLLEQALDDAALREVNPGGAALDDPVDRRRRPRDRSAGRRARRADDALRAAGIGPRHLSLHAQLQDRTAGSAIGTGVSTGPGAGNGEVPGRETEPRGAPSNA